MTVVVWVVYNCLVFKPNIAPESAHASKNCSVCLICEKYLECEGCRNVLMWEGRWMLGSQMSVNLWAHKTLRRAMLWKCFVLCNISLFVFIWMGTFWSCSISCTLCVTYLQQYISNSDVSCYCWLSCMHICVSLSTISRTTLLTPPNTNKNIHCHLLCIIL